MMKINWFECDLKVYDSFGMEIDITELPMKDRRDIANAIVNGNKCGSYSSTVVQQDIIENLDHAFVGKLEAVCNLHQFEVRKRELEHEDRVRLSKLIENNTESEEEDHGEL